MRNYLSIGADVLQQIICNIRIRRAPRHDNLDFKPIITRTSNIHPSSIVTTDRVYDSEDNHVLVGYSLHTFSIILARYEYSTDMENHLVCIESRLNMNVPNSCTTKETKMRL